MPGKIIKRVRERQAKAEERAYRWAILEYHRDVIRHRKIEASPTGADAFMCMVSAAQPETATPRATAWKELKRWLWGPTHGRMTP